MAEAVPTTERAEPAEKARLRTALVQQLKAISPVDRLKASEAASATLVQLLERSVPPGVPVALFAPTPTELSCEPAVAPLATRHPLAYPRVDGTRIRFQQAGFASLTAHTSLVREPPVDAPEVVPAAVVIPGRAFDRRGIRLGRGAGFYDRLLDGLAPEILLIGYVYAFQVLDELPREPHDRWVQLLVTEKGGPLRCRHPEALYPTH